MTPSPSPIRVPARSFSAAKENQITVTEVECSTQLLRNLIPKAKSEHERTLYRDVVQSYQEAAIRLLGRTWSDDHGQDIAEYAVMLAVILVIVVGTVRLIGSNANTVFSQAASSIQ
jgi:Flp pilus assembly pilin Flp